MAVVRLGKGAGATGTTTASWTGFNFITSDANTVCIVLVDISTSVGTTTCSVKYDTAGANVTMKQLGIANSGSGFSAVGIYYLFNPGTGAKNITATPATGTIAQTIGIDVAFANVSSIGAKQNVATMAHTVTSVANGYALRVLANGVTTGTLNNTTELATGASVTGTGDFIAVQSAAGATTVAFTASGTATTPLSMGCTVNPAGQMSYLQSATSAEVNALTAAAVMPGPSFVGDVIVAAFKVGTLGTAALTGVTDTKGNTYSVASPLNATGTRGIWIYYAPVTTAADAGTNTVTVTFTVVAPGNLELLVAEYDGVDPIKPFDTHHEGNATTGTALDSGNTPLTSQANELVFGYGVGAGSASAAGAGFTGRIVGTDPAISLLEDKVVSAIGAYNATGTITTGAWMMSCATFKQELVFPGEYQGLPVPIRRSGFY